MKKVHASPHIPYDQHQRVCQELDTAQATLSAVAALLQNPTLTHKEVRVRAAIALALEAQRPTDNPSAIFPLDLGQLAKHSGLIPSTTAGDIVARNSAFISGRKLAGEAVAAMNDAGCFTVYQHPKERDENGTITGCRVVIQILETHPNLIRRCNTNGTRTLQKPRGTSSRPVCPDCGPDAPVIERKTTRCICGACGQTLTARATSDRELPVIQTLETGETGEEEGTGFQTLESGEILPQQWLAPISENIPPELTERPQWAIWRAVERDGKWTKPPLDPRTGKLARCDDATTWATFAEALEGMKRYGADGIGYMFSGDDPYTGIDLDALDARAYRIVEQLASYSECSPSGLGVHVIVRAKKPEGGCRRGPVEIYNQARFLTITGHRIDGTPVTIEHRQQQLAAVHAEVFPVAPTVTRTAATTRAASDDDGALLDRAMRAPNGTAFRALMAGDYSGYPSHSEGTWHLLLRLAYWASGDAERMDRLYRASGMFDTADWDRPDGMYGTHGQRDLHRARQAWASKNTPSPVFSDAPQQTAAISVDIISSKGATTKTSVLSYQLD